MLKGIFRQKTGPARFIDIVGSPIQATPGQRAITYLTSPDVLAGMLPVAMAAYGYAELAGYNAAGFAALYGGSATLVFNAISRLTARVLSGKFRTAAIDPTGQTKLNTAHLAARNRQEEQKQLVKKMGALAGAAALTSITTNMDTILGIAAYLKQGMQPHPYYFLYLGIPVTAIWTTAAAARRAVNLSRGRYSVVYHV